MSKGLGEMDNMVTRSGSKITAARASIIFDHGLSFLECCNMLGNMLQLCCPPPTKPCVFSVDPTLVVSCSPSEGVGAHNGFEGRETRFYIDIVC
jgi:hypothetical protein